MMWLLPDALGGGTNEDDDDAMFNEPICGRG